MTPRTLNPLFAIALALFTGCPAAPVQPRTEDSPDGSFITLPDAGLPACQGNHDSQIERSEVVFVPGVTVRYRINPAGTLVPVNVNGAAQPDGTHVWDFSSIAGDTVELSLLGVSGQWFASDYPTGQYASRLDPRSPDLGVYRATDTAVQLLGVAGGTASEGTLAPYDTPVDILQFPLYQGVHWMASAMTLDAEFDGTPVASRDQYTVTVDEVGVVRLPTLVFTQALRVHVEVTQTFPAGPGTRKIQYLYFAECYGEIARITSQAGEVNPDFTLATEFRRLGL